MKLNDLRDWIKSHVDSLGLDYGFQYSVGRFVESENKKEDVIIAIRQNGGATKPPFLRYNVYQVMIISGQYFMSPVDSKGEDQDFSEDDPMSQFGRSPTPKQRVYDLNDTWEEGELIAETIEIASIGKPPCNATGIKLLGSKAGPQYLDDGRIYYTLDLEVII